VHANNDPGRYGSSFADIYDDWYPGGDELDVVAHLARHLGPRPRVLELGVGTGRLALPLNDAGFDVVGLDASSEMLDAIAIKDPGGSIQTVLADAADPSGWDAAGLVGCFSGVLAACNLLLNLASPHDQHACVAGAAGRLRIGGVFAVELQQIRSDTTGDVSYELSVAAGDVPVVIATETDQSTGTVLGQHIELHADGTARIRPWSVCPVELATIDRWCDESGLELTERHADWSGRTWDPDSPTSVSTYRRNA
jgi:SAM-dependent methyltransferase